MTDYSVAFLGLGSNQDDPYEQLCLAFNKLRHMPNCKYINNSSIYSSEPVGPQNQPGFLNAVAEIKTRMTPLELLSELQFIENKMGRKKTRHWGPRIIDLDILLYNDQLLNNPRLVIPHPEMHKRGFVIVPLLELAPDIIIPGHGSAQELLNRIDTDDIKLCDKS